MRSELRDLLWVAGSFLLGSILAALIMTIGPSPDDSKTVVVPAPTVIVTVNPIPAATCWVDEYEEGKTTRRVC